MRKRCAQLVHGLCRRYLPAELKKVVVWIEACLYPAKAQAYLTSFHSQKRAVTPVVSWLVHTIHTPYKEQKKIKLNQLLLSTVENF